MHPLGVHRHGQVNRFDIDGEPDAFAGCNREHDGHGVVQEAGQFDLLDLQLVHTGFDAGHVE